MMALFANIIILAFVSSSYLEPSYQSNPSGPQMAQAVRVMVRCRPMSRTEQENVIRYPEFNDYLHLSKTSITPLGHTSVVKIDMEAKQVNLYKQNTNQKPKSFSFDFVFDPDSTQALIYEQSAFTLVESVLGGYNGTIFAYGQTGCGKTHTMMGNDTEDGKGIIPRTFGQIIAVTQSEENKTHLIRCSFIEIYNQQIHDLLGKDAKARLDLKESPQKGLFVKDLSQPTVDCIAKISMYMESGFKNRATRATKMNAESSRSHSIFTIYIDSQESDDAGNDHFKASKLNLVDLAGSERTAKTGATGEGMKQATKINLSLSALGNVISALVDGKIHHIPYRDSKLTRLLQDSLGGNTKTIMIAALSPASYNYDETLSTLYYASRAKFIKNKPIINEDPKDAMLREYMDEIKRLKNMLENGLMPNLPAGLTGSSAIGRVLARRGDSKESKELEEQLQKKESMLKMEQQQKRLLNEKLEELQRIVHKDKNKDIEVGKELEKMKRLKEKLKEQKKKEEEFRKEQEKRQSQFLSIEKSYQNVSEERESLKKKLDELTSRSEAVESQLRDMQHQHVEEKSQLLESVRLQEKQLKKYQAVLAILMNEDSLDQILRRTEWDQEKEDWTIPQFTYKERTINFPKVHDTKQFVQNEKEKKEVIFKQKPQPPVQRKPQDSPFRMNSIVKIARQSSESLIMPMGRLSTQLLRPQAGPFRIEGLQRVPSQQQMEDRRRLSDRLEPLGSGQR